MHRENSRPDIDGLRALAVLSVMFFNAGIGPFSGGYVGVSSLPYTNREINASTQALLDDLNDPDQRAGLNTMLRGLAFFQSNVGENQRPLDAMGSDQKTFRELVHTEMIEIERTLAERGY